jgi:hypothetical protein
VSVPESPIELGRLQPTASVDGVAVNGGYAYLVSSSAGMAVVDVRDPSLPTVCGAFESVGNARQLAEVSGDFYLADGWAGMHAFDTSSCPGSVPIPARIRRPDRRVVP